MKILFLTYGNFHGGSIKMTAWLANRLVSHHDVTYCKTVKGKPFYKLDKRIKFIELDCYKNKAFWYRNSISILSLATKLTALQKKENYDLIINFSDHDFYILPLVKRLTGVKILVSQRVDPYFCKKRSDRFRFWLYKKCDGLVCQTKSALDYFSEDLKKQTGAVVIANPAIRKAKTFWNREEPHDYIISLARLDIPQKRQDILIKAFAEVHEKHPEIKLYLYGLPIADGKEVLDKLISEFNLEGSVVYKGITDDSLNIMSKAVMLVLSSDYEGIPNVILEAMDVGLPVVSTDCSPGGARLLIDADDKGIIVPCGDVKKLAQAMIYVIEHKAEAAEMAKNAERSLERFSEENITKQWLDYIDEII